MWFYATRQSLTESLTATACQSTIQSVTVVSHRTTFVTQYGVLCLLGRVACWMYDSQKACRIHSQSVKQSYRVAVQCATKSLTECQWLSHVVAWWSIVFDDVMWCDLMFCVRATFSLKGISWERLSFGRVVSCMCVTVCVLWTVISWQRGCMGNCISEGGTAVLVWLIKWQTDWLTAWLL